MTWTVGRIVVEATGGMILQHTTTNGEYLRMLDASGSIISAISGDFDIRLTFRNPSMPYGNDSHIVAWGGYNLGGLTIRYNSATSLGIIIWGPVGSNNFVAPDITLSENPFASGSTVRCLRVTRLASGQTFTVYKGTTVDGPWTQIGTTTIGTFTMATPAGIANYLFSAGVPAGSGVQNTSNGDIYNFRVYPNVGGTGLPTINADFTTLHSIPVTSVAGSFSDAAGASWEYNAVNFVAP